MINGGVHKVHHEKTAEKQLRKTTIYGEMQYFSIAFGIELMQSNIFGVAKEETIIIVTLNT